MQVNETPQFVKDELLNNESIVWIGKPNPLAALCMASPIFIIAGLFSIGIIKDLIDSINKHLPLPFTLFQSIGLVFVVIFISVPLNQCFKFLSKLYVVTDKRILIVTGNNNRTVEYYDKKTLTPMMSMTFMGLTNLCWSAPGTHTDSDGDARKNTLWFMGIEPREVYKISSEPFPKMSELGRNLPR